MLSFNSREGFDSVFAYNAYDTHWWFDDNQEGFKECKFIEPANEPSYCDNNYCNENKNNIMKIECPWFSTVKKDDSTIVVSVKQNDTEEERSQNIYIKDGSYTGMFIITQCFELIDELSKEEFLFSVEGGVDSVTVTKNIGSSLVLSGSGIAVGHESTHHYFSPPYIVEGSWYTISIPDEKKIIFSINKNETGKERDFTATLDPDYICGYSKVKIIQSPE
jgi:hypothetical protein